MANVKKGMRRVTLVISILAALALFVLVLIEGDLKQPPGWIGLIVFELILIGIIWLIYFVVNWIINGFKSETKTQGN